MSLPIRFGLSHCHLLQDQDATEDEKGSRGKVGAGQIESLWTVVVQDLFTSSHERKALGFQLFNILLPYLQYVSSHASHFC